MNLKSLRSSVEAAIATYRYSVHAEAIGQPLPSHRVQAELDAMRSALVEPYVADVELRDTLDQIHIEQPITRSCAVVAEDSKCGAVLAFDPVENELLLAIRHDATLVSFGVRGDAVGCFMAR